MASPLHKVSINFQPLHIPRHCFGSLIILLKHLERTQESSAITLCNDLLPIQYNNFGKGLPHSRELTFHCSTQFVSSNLLCGKIVISSDLLYITVEMSITASIFTLATKAADHVETRNTEHNIIMLFLYYIFWS